MDNFATSFIFQITLQSIDPDKTYWLSGDHRKSYISWRLGRSQDLWTRFATVSSLTSNQEFAVGTSSGKIRTKLEIILKTFLDLKYRNEHL